MRASPYLLRKTQLGPHTPFWVGTSGGGLPLTDAISSVCGFGMDICSHVGPWPLPSFSFAGCLTWAEGVGWA